MTSDFFKAEDFDFNNHDEERELCTWGSFGKDGTSECHRSKIKDLSTNHIYNILRTQELNSLTMMLFVRELCWRIEHD